MEMLETGVDERAHALSAGGWVEVVGDSVGCPVAWKAKAADEFGLDGAEFWRRLQIDSVALPALNLADFLGRVSRDSLYSAA
ncbi:hypothetical protein [Mycobacteroides abscessus]|uniref:hypothetical protein n=1 Tax=Mycobacteroides abscessus TaxID=36809 RepID=UPI0013FD08BD|nr:hypothetical protein [Mycobacteroides abscessus]